MFSMASLHWVSCRAGLKRGADGVDAGKVWLGVGRGVEENVNRGVALNCWVLGRGVCSCACACFLITNRWGEGVCSRSGITSGCAIGGAHHRRRRHVVNLMSCRMAKSIKAFSVGN